MKKIIKVTLPVALAEDLEKSASASAMTKSAYIASLLKAQTGPKQGPNRAQTGPKQGPNRAQTGPKPRAHGRQREKNTVRTPLVSPQGDLFLSSFSSLFSNKPEFNCPEFELAWKRFVEMRSEPKTNPPPVSAGTAEVFAEQFEKYDLQQVLDALGESTVSGWAGVFPKKKPPPAKEDDEWADVSPHITRPYHMWKE